MRSLRPATQAKLDRLVAMATRLGWTVQDDQRGILKIAKQPSTLDFLTGLPCWHGRRYVVHYGVGAILGIRAIEDYAYDPRGFSQISLVEALRRLGKDVTYAGIDSKAAEETESDRFHTRCHFAPAQPPASGRWLTCTCGHHVDDHAYGDEDCKHCACGFYADRTAEEECYPQGSLPWLSTPNEVTS